MTFYSYGDFSHYFQELLSSGQSVPTTTEIHLSARGCLHGQRSHPQSARGCSQEDRIRDRSRNQLGGEHGQLYVVPSKPKAESFDIVVTSRIVVCRQLAFAFSYLRSTYLYVLLVLLYD